jgi:hypothetical protein
LKWLKKAMLSWRRSTSCDAERLAELDVGIEGEGRLDDLIHGAWP